MKNSDLGFRNGELEIEIYELGFLDLGIKAADKYHIEKILKIRALVPL